MRNLKHTIKIIILSVLALAFGYYMISSGILYLHYNDMKATIQFGSIAAMILIVYMLVFMSDELLPLIQKRKQQSVDRNLGKEEELHIEQPVIEKPFSQQESQIEDRKQQETGIKNDALMGDRPTYENTIENWNVKKHLVPYLIIFFLIEVIAAFVCYQLLGKLRMLTIITASILLALFMLLILLKKQRGDACVTFALTHRQEIEEKAVHDATCKALWLEAVTARYQGDCNLFLELLVAYPAAMILSFYTDMHILLMILLLLMIGIPLSLLRAYQVRRADLNIITAINEQKNAAVLGMLLDFYAIGRRTCKPMFNVHTFMVIALHQQGLYEIAYQLLKLIKFRRGTVYQLYFRALALLCYEGYQDKQAMISVVSEMEQIFSTKKLKSIDIVKRSRFIYELSIAYLDNLDEQMKALVEKSHTMSGLYQQIALKFQEDLHQK